LKDLQRDPLTVGAVRAIHEQVNLPVAIDEEKLLLDLDLAETWLRNRQTFESQKDRGQKLRDAKSTADQLLKFIDDDAIRLDLSQRTSLSLVKNQIEAVVEALEDASKQFAVAERHARKKPARNRQLLGTDFSPFEWFVGKSLLGVYKKHYGRSAIGNETGPFARFALACCRSLNVTNAGKAYSVASVLKAARNVAHGNARRRG
jgi:hypothetical protein